MSQNVVGPTKSYKAGADLSSAQYYIVKQDANGDVVKASAATDALIGTVTNKPESGEETIVQVRSGGGTGKVKLGGTVTVGGRLTSDSNGKAVATTTNGNEVFGLALEAGVVNDVVEYMPSTDKYYA